MTTITSIDRRTPVTTRQVAWGQGVLKCSVVGPGGNPKARKVWLYEEKDGYSGALRNAPKRVISAKVSDPSTGIAEFRNLDQACTYTVIAYDYTGQFDPVIKGGLTPEPME